MPHERHSFFFHISTAGMATDRPAGSLVGRRGILASTNTNWPFRVTMQAVGTASDPAHPTTAAYHGITAVLQLVPRQLTTEPTNWSTMVGYTVYQYTQDNFQLQLPCQVAGNVWLQGTLTLESDYPPYNSGQNQYLTDLNSMQFFGYGDNRPLNGTVYLPYSKTASSTLSQVGLLGISTVNTSPSTVSGWSFPGSITSYQLYPGRKIVSGGHVRLERREYHAGSQSADQSTGVVLCQRQCDDWQQYHHQRNAGC